MSDEQHRSTITVVVDDSAAQRAMDKLLTKMQAAVSAAKGLRIGGGGAPGIGGTGSTTSTASTPVPPSLPGGAASTSAQPAGGGPTAAGGGVGSTADGVGGGRAAQESWAVRAASYAPSMVGAMAPSPGAPYSLAGRGLMAGAQMMRQRAMQQAVVQAAAARAGGAAATGAGEMAAAGAASGGRVAGIVGATLGAAGALGTGTGLSYRYGRIQEAAAMERAREQARVAGGADLGLESARIREATGRYGIGAGEATSTLADYYKQIGFRGAGEGAMSPWSAMLGGVGPGALASWQQGKSSREVAANRASLPRGLGAASALGLTGANAEDFLQRIASASEQMADQGLTLNRESVVSMAESLGQTAAFGGRGAGAALKLTEIGQGATQQLKAPLAGLAEAAVMSKAMQGGGSYLDILQRSEGMSQDPEAIRQAVIGMGPEYASLAFAGRFGTKQARTYAGNLPTALGAVSEGEGVGATQRLSISEAEGARRLTAAATRDIDVATALIDGVKGLEAAMSRFSSVFDGLTQDISKALGVWNR